MRLEPIAWEGRLPVVTAQPDLPLRLVHQLVRPVLLESMLLQLVLQYVPIVGLEHLLTSPAWLSALAVLPGDTPQHQGAVSVRPVMLGPIQMRGLLAVLTALPEHLAKLRQLPVLVARRDTRRLQQLRAAQLAPLELSPPRLGYLSVQIARLEPIAWAVLRLAQTVLRDIPQPRVLRLVHRALRAQLMRQLAVVAALSVLLEVMRTKQVELSVIPVHRGQLIPPLVEQDVIPVGQERSLPHLG